MVLVAFRAHILTHAGKSSALDMRNLLPGETLQPREHSAENLAQYCPTYQNVTVGPESAVLCQSHNESKPVEMLP